jgi:hypothetical protein
MQPLRQVNADASRGAGIVGNNTAVVGQSFPFRVMYRHT